MKRIVLACILMIASTIIIGSENQALDLNVRLINRYTPSQEPIKIGNKIFQENLLRSLPAEDRKILEKIAAPSSIAALYGINNQIIRKLDLSKITEMGKKNEPFRKAIDGMIVDTLDTRNLWCPNREICCSDDNGMSSVVSGFIAMVSVPFGLMGLVGLANKMPCLVYSVAPIMVTPPVVTCVAIEGCACFCMRCCQERETWEISSNPNEHEHD